MNVVLVLIIYAICLYFVSSVYSIYRFVIEYTYFTKADKNKEAKLKHKLCSFVLSCCMNKKRRFEGGEIRNYMGELAISDLKALYLRHLEYLDEAKKNLKEDEERKKNAFNADFQRTSQKKRLWIPHREPDLSENARFLRIQEKRI